MCGLCVCYSISVFPSVYGCVFVSLVSDSGETGSLKLFQFNTISYVGYGLLVHIMESQLHGKHRCYCTSNKVSIGQGMWRKSCLILIRTLWMIIIATPVLASLLPWHQLLWKGSIIKTNWFCWFGHRSTSACIMKLHFLLKNRMPSLNSISFSSNIDNLNVVWCLATIGH